MTSTTPSSFSESLDRADRLRQLQMWQASETVRAHVGVDDGLSSMLECLGLEGAQRPES